MSENEVYKVKVMFGDEELELISKESEEYILDLINYIKDQDIKIQTNTKNSNLTPVRSRLLLSINIADDYFKEKNKIKHFKDTINEQIEIIQDLKKQNLDLIETNKKNKDNLEKYNTIIENITQEKELQAKQIAKLQLELKDIDNINIKLIDNKKILEDRIQKITNENKRLLNQSNQIDNQINNKLEKRIKELEEQLLQSQNELNEFIEHFDNT